MAYDQVQKKRAGRRAAILIASVAGLCALAAGGWYWIAGTVGERFTVMRDRLASQGRVLNCDGQDIRGFPFRVGLFCERIAYADPVNAVTFSAGELRSAAQVYRPGHVIAELDGPVDLTMPGLAPLTLEWEDLQSSSLVSLGGPEQVSLVVEALSVSANDFGVRSRLGTMGELQFHARENPEADNQGMLDTALFIEDWRIDMGGEAQSDAIALRLETGLADGITQMRAGFDPLAILRRDGGSGELRSFRLELENGAFLAVKGPFSLDAAGLLSGSFTIDARDPVALASFAGELFPPLGNILEEPARIINGLAAANGSVPQIEGLQIRVEGGVVFAGFFPLGKLPPIFTVD